MLGVTDRSGRRPMGLNPGGVPRVQDDTPHFSAPDQEIFRRLAGTLLRDDYQEEDQVHVRAEDPAVL
jgi:hypothetical protein